MLKRIRICMQTKIVTVEENRYPSINEDIISVIVRISDTKVFLTVYKDTLQNHYTLAYHAYDFNYDDSYHAFIDDTNLEYIMRRYSHLLRNLA